MGRYYWDKKDTVEDCRSVSTSFLKKHGYFSEPCSMSGTIFWENYYGKETSSIGITVSTLDSVGYMRFYYTVTDRNTGEKTDYDYKVPLTTTPCNYGGVRYWFICPLSKNGVYCGRRVEKLYKAPGANYFGCRHCFDLSYESRNKSRHGMFGAFGRVLETDRRIKELTGKTKRWLYGSRPTRKARKLNKLRQRMDIYLSASKPFLSRFSDETGT